MCPVCACQAEILRLQERISQLEAALAEAQTTVPLPVFTAEALKSATLQQELLTANDRLRESVAECQRLQIIVQRLHASVSAARVRVGVVRGGGVTKSNVTAGQRLMAVDGRVRQLSPPLLTLPFVCVRLRGAKCGLCRSRAAVLACLDVAATV